MSLLQTFRVAVRALLRNKLRSFLTMLGVIIGVAAVIAMVAIGEGAKARVRDTFTAMGTSQAHRDLGLHHASRSARGFW
jgi:putative ABC transport system permease protein